MAQRTTTTLVHEQIQKVKEEVEKLVRCYENQQKELEQIERGNPKIKNQIKTIKNTVGQFKKYFENLRGINLIRAENVNARIDMFFLKGEKMVEKEKKEEIKQVEKKLSKLDKMKQLFKKI
jgi:uncharacterized phage infection (PIP) family protein YhgE